MAFHEQFPKRSKKVFGWLMVIVVACCSYGIFYHTIEKFACTDEQKRGGPLIGVSLETSSISGVYPEINHPAAWGYPHDYGKPSIS